MATVPYSGLRTEKPSAQRTEQLRYYGPDAPAAAFGVSSGKEAIGGAISNLGAVMEREAATWRAREEQITKQDTEVNFQAKVGELNAGTLAMRQTAPPNGSGHVAGWTRTVDPQIDEWLKAQPKWLQGEYATRWQQWREQGTIGEMEFQKKQQDSYSNLNLDKGRLSEANRIQAGNGDPAITDYSEQSIAQIRKNSTLSELDQEKDELATQQFLRQQELQARVRANPALARPSEDILTTQESSNNPRIVNPLGFVGLYQFGAPRLETIGLYTPSPGELDGWNTRPGGAEKWGGTFSIPGFPEVKTVEDFRNSIPAQRAAYAIHRQQLGEEIVSRGLTKYIGQKDANGTTITEAGLIFAAHIRGSAGLQEYLETGRDPKDANGKGASDYMKLGAAGNAESLRSDPRYQFLDPQSMNAVIRQGEAENNQMQIQQAKLKSNAEAEYVNGMLFGVAAGKIGLQDANNAVSAGKIADYDNYSKVVNAIEQRDKDLIEVRKAVAWRNNPNTVGTPDDHKMLNKAFAFEGGRARLEAKDAAYVNNVIIPMAENKKIVPSDAIDTVRALTRHSDPTKSAFGFQTMNKLAATVPWQLTREDEIELTAWNKLRPAFDDEAWAKRQQRMQGPEGASVRKLLTAQFNEGAAAVKNYRSVDEIVENVDNERSWLPNIIRPNNMPNSQKLAMADDVRAIAEALHVGGGGDMTPEQVWSEAERIAKKDWKRSNAGIGGVMKYAPEAVIQPSPDGTWTYVQEQANAVYDAAAGAKQIPPTALELDRQERLAAARATGDERALRIEQEFNRTEPYRRPFFIVADQQTAIEVNAYRKGVAIANKPADEPPFPSYAIMYGDDIGGFKSVDGARFVPRPDMGRARSGVETQRRLGTIQDLTTRQVEDEAGQMRRSRAVTKRDWSVGEPEERAPPQPDIPIRGSVGEDQPGGDVGADVLQRRGLGGETIQEPEIGDAELKGGSGEDTLDDAELETLDSGYRVPKEPKEPDASKSGPPPFRGMDNTPLSELKRDLVEMDKLLGNYPPTDKPGERVEHAFKRMTDGTVRANRQLSLELAQKYGVNPKRDGESDEAFAKRILEKALVDYEAGVLTLKEHMKKFDKKLKGK